MITHGNKQISEIVYARKASEGGGAVRLTNIIRGAQVVFGGLEPFIYWLTKATRVAILAAFGNTDGKAVIKATNAYLNALAATDPNKASALAGFINEDPMLVCSLGLQPQGVTMPIRALHANTGGYITSNISLVGMHNLNWKWSVDALVSKGYLIQIGSRFSDPGSNGLIIDLGANGYGQVRGYFVPGSGIWVNIGSGLSAGTIYSMKMNYDQKTLQIDDKTPNSFTHTMSNGINFEININNSRFIVAELDGCLIIPFIREGVIGILDVENNDFYTNTGTGNVDINYTLPDGTPWTPLNQTP